MDSTLDHERIKQLIAAGRKAEARAALAAHLKTNPRDGRAWYALGLVVDDPEQRAYCQGKASEFAPPPLRTSAPARSPVWQVWNVIALLGLLLAVIGVFCGVMGDPNGPFRDSLMVLAGVGGLALVIALVMRAVV